MPGPEAADDLALLERSVREAGEIARNFFGRDVKRWDKGEGQPVSEADIAVNDHLAARLRGARPEYGWLSEESLEDPRRHGADATFVVDPIDGTIAFLKGRPHFTICAAVVRQGRPLCGVVYNPISEEFYAARRGGGAWRNGEAIHVSAQAGLEGARLLAGKAIFEHQFWSTPPQTPWPAMTLETRGSIAYRLVLVADGQFDAALALSSKRDWDLAAADVIVSEAGGRVTDHRGRSFVYNTASALLPSLVAAGAALHAALIEKLAPVALPPPNS